ncbi:G-type lectin S-receptor-like serine/threonine-protein kinase LECRK3 [Elaeis guineensis]|uniref:G-type lectin S-receptor-like serine/threonine-protein kinase LECRK3 n=1 Tax=Elaeis guineensis var. tenera TaxID=51953 RepID=UPI003C6DB17A
MASATSYILFPLIFSLAFALEAARPRQSNITLGTSLHPSTNPTSWLSPNGRFAFGFYPEGTGFSIGIWLVPSPENTTVIWTAGRDDLLVTKDAVLKLTREGLKLLQNSEWRLISRYIYTSTGAFSASMLDSGNFVIYDSNFNVISETFDNPTDTIMAGQVLHTGSELVSSVSETNHSSGKFQLSVQIDGQIVWCPAASPDISEDAYHSIGPYLEGYQGLNLDDNGRLYLFNGSATFNLTKGFWNRTTRVYRATLDVDGIFRLYSHNLELNTGQEVLAEIPKLTDLCGVKGTCGLNSYCTSAQGVVACECLPGFDYLDGNRTSSGCTRNFTTSGCYLNNDNTTYMSTLENVTWSVDAYTEQTYSTSKEDCRDACLKDCFCDAALFQVNRCWKQGLPLRYVIRDSTEYCATFIKRVNMSAGEGHVSSVAENPAAAPVTTTNRKFSTKILIVSVALITGIISTLAALMFIFYRYQDGRYRRMRRNREPALVDEIAPRSFSYRELREATDGFKEELGKGAFGTVFKGTLPRGQRVIAVKRLEKVVAEGEREFRTEMRTIGRTHHKNLVRLLGFCDESTNRLLVYEYMSNGSLADLIFKADRRPGWDERVGIALDIARGIHYLHEECETRIIHCDIKPQNILMDDNRTAKISDFGLAKLLMPSQTRTFTGIRGTRGYLAPEWHKSAPISVKADVYSFGIVLLEIVCCRRNMELEAEADAIILLDWVHHCFMAGELEKLVPDEVDVIELNRFVKVGLWCAQSEPGTRPCMKNVVMMLEGNVDISLPPPGFSS